jgi:hypothetical protein
MKRFLPLFFLISLIVQTGLTAPRDRISILSRQDYYTTEARGEILIFLRGKTPPVTADIFSGEDPLITGLKLSAGMNRIPVVLSGLSAGDHPFRCLLRDRHEQVLLDTVILLKKLPPRLNGVKTDRLHGTLIVGGLPFIPFGFYTYSPVQPTLPEEEVVRGFNMMSPYQKITDKTFKERKAYMDRCAALGMKVNYNLLSVAGGGGVGSKTDMTDRERRELLIREVKAFRDHPALLAWYIADEPVGQGHPPAPLVETYRLIKELDPYHPVTMVFMSPREAWRYANAMDIVMADPYPVPNRPVTEVEYVTKMLERNLYPELPVWIVPQAFGGGEHWRREPTPAEMRVMTWMALIHGARGIQYFIRKGLNSFPKSLIAWDECGQIALETAELTPWFAEGREVTGLRSGQANVRVKGWEKDSTLVVVCINTVNRPLPLQVSLPQSYRKGVGEVMFEDRPAEITRGRIRDMIDAYGRRVFKITRAGAERIVTDTLNMMEDPGFEYLPVTGIPSACYARTGRDRGATFFVDARRAHSGGHSLRMITPADGEGVTLSFFPAYLEYGHTYRFSLWARGAPRKDTWPEKSFLYRLFHKKPAAPSFTVNAGGITDSTFLLTTGWKKYEMFVTLDDSLTPVMRVSLSLSLDTRGTAWFDDLSLVPVVLMHTAVAVPGGSLQIILQTPVKDAVLRYDTEGRVPTLSSPLYEGPALITRDASFVAGVFREGELLGILEQDVTIHKALGCKPRLEHSFSGSYDGGGPGALTDGLLARAAYKDPRWQGFFGDDLVATLDLGKMTEIRSIEAGFLQQLNVHIHYPRQASFFVSRDGKNFSLLYYGHPEEPSREEGPEKLVISWAEHPVQARYVRVIANNVDTIPAWAPGAGSKAWLFCDEIIVK